jgi:hypothetical protein
LGIPTEIAGREAGRAYSEATPELLASPALKVIGSFVGDPIIKALSVSSPCLERPVPPWRLRLDSLGEETALKFF